jgi:hypothetical protein
VEQYFRVLGVDRMKPSKSGRSKMLVQHSSTFSPSLPIRHEAKIPIPADTGNENSAQILDRWNA